MQDTSPETWPHVIVVGAGFSRLQVAQVLRGAPIRVTVIDMIRWAWSYLTYQHGARLITESCTDPSPFPITRQAPGGKSSGAPAPIEDRASSISH